MTAVLEARGLGKRYRSRWALTDCTVSVPAGHVVGLVGPNGAGKTTLLQLATGLLAPTTGTIEVTGGRPAADPAQLARVGFVAQDTPTYAGLSIADHLRLGAHLNPRWDLRYAEQRISRLGLDPAQKAGKLSGGQRAQLALTLALAKRPELLVLDEPVASLDPLARREFLQDVQDAVAEHRMSVLLSSHLVADLEQVCDYLIVLTAARVQLTGTIPDLLATHHRLTGPPGATATVRAGREVISTDHTDGQTTLLVRTDSPVPEPDPEPGTGLSREPDPVPDPTWTVSRVSLEDLVLAYLSRAATTVRTHRPTEEVPSCSG